MVEARAKRFESRSKIRDRKIECGSLGRTIDD